MLLIELVTQAVKGFSPQSRALLKPGYNVLVPPAATPAGLEDLLSALYFNDGRGGDAMLGTGKAPARVGLTVQGRDGLTYRLVRNLGGAGALHRLEQNGTWSVVSQETLDIANALRTALGLPSRGQFDEIFCLSAKQFPSRHQAERPAAAAGKPLGSGPAPAERKLRPNALVEAAMAAAKPQQFDPAKAQQDIARLKQEIEVGKRIEDEQYKLEGLQQRIFQLQQKVKQLDKLVAEVDQVRQAAAGGGHSFDSLGLPPDAMERAARFDDALKKRDDSIAKLRDEDRIAREKAASAKPEPLWRNRNLLIGLGLGLVTLLVGIVFRGEALGYVGLLDIPAFGFAGLCALQWIGQLQYEDSLLRKLEVNKDREQKVAGAFENEYFPISFAMKTIGVETGEDFLAYFKKRAEAEAQLAQAEAKLAAVQADPSVNRALEEHDALVVEAKALESKIGDMGAGMMRSWREAERELQEIEDMLAGGGSQPQAPASLGGSFEQPGDKPAKDDPLPKLLQGAVELFSGATVESLGQMLRDRIAQYLVALTDKRYSGVQIGAGGEATLVAPGRTVPAGQLSDLDLDILYLSTRLTLLERLAPMTRLPAVLDEPFVGWDDAKLQLLSRMLKHIATLTQVLHVSAHPAHRGFADNAAQL